MPNVSINKLSKIINNESKAYCSTSIIGVFITNKLFWCASAFDLVGLDGSTSRSEDQLAYFVSC